MAVACLFCERETADPERDGYADCGYKGPEKDVVRWLCPDCYRIVYDEAISHIGDYE